MLRHVATVLLTFQRFPIAPGNSVQHECDMGAPVQPHGGYPGLLLDKSVRGASMQLAMPRDGAIILSLISIAKPRYYQQNVAR
jgi:hypothetical protein